MEITNDVGQAFIRDISERRAEFGSRKSSWSASSPKPEDKIQGCEP
jgi:hypothetical protein